jgi:hypothetical protein
MERDNLFAAMLLVITAVTLSAQTTPKKFLTAPLTIEDQGSFFVGGVKKITDHASAPTLPAAPTPLPDAPHQITIGQMYVQFQIPARKYGGWPVIMVHGSAHTAAALESTPDGREGWYPYFVRKGVPSYVVDQSGRGRSGFDESVLNEGKGPGIPRITDDGAWTNWFGHLVPANSTIRTGRLIPHGDPADPDPHPDKFEHVAPLFPLEAVDEYYKQLVPNGEVTLPGSTCESCDPKELSPANTWTPQNLATLVEQLGGAVVVTHSQAGIMGHHMARILKERGHLNLLKGLVTLEGSCSLPNSGLTAADFDNVAYMALKGDYTATSAVCQETVDAINARRASKQGTAKADYLKLDEMGILGVTHMMMLDKKNLEIADIIYNWIGKNVPTSRNRRSTSTR